QHAVQNTNELRDHRFDVLRIVAHGGAGSRGIVGLARRAENRRLRVQIIDSVESAEQGEDHVAIVDGGGNGRRKGRAAGGPTLLIERSHGKTRRTRIEEPNRRVVRHFATSVLWLFGSYYRPLPLPRPRPRPRSRSGLAARADMLASIRMPTAS